MKEYAFLLENKLYEKYTICEIRAIFHMAEKVYAKHAFSKENICDVVDLLYPSLSDESKNEVLDAYWYVMTETIGRLH